AWGALGRGHWFFRYAVVLLLVASWLFASDDRLALLFLAQSLVVVLQLSYLRARETAGHEPQRPHFSLQDLLLAMVLIGGALGILARLHAAGYMHWLQDILPGAALGGLTLVAVWFARSRRSIWLRSAVLLLMVPSWLMGLWLWMADRSRASWARATAVLTLVIIAALPARLYYKEVTTSLGTYISPPADNGFADLLTAAEMADTSSTDVDKLSDEELEVYLNRLRPAFTLVEKGLARSCQMVLRDDMTDNMISAECKQLERLTNLVAARARLQAQNGNIAGAVQNYLEAIEIGAATSRGGVLGHDAFGFVMEGLGVEGLQKIIEGLDDAGCHALCERLAAIDSQREPLTNPMGREQLYLKKAYPWKYRVYPMIGGINASKDATWEAIVGIKRARLRVLVCHLALRRAWLAEYR
ncbi:MAG: hypothetical protein ACREHD_02675, partial [Pirellulales bacterium]